MSIIARKMSKEIRRWLKIAQISNQMSNSSKPLVNSLKVSLQTTL